MSEPPPEASCAGQVFALSQRCTGCPCARRALTSPHLKHNSKQIEIMHTHMNSMNVLPSCWLHCWATAAELAQTFRLGLTGTGRDKKLGKVTVDKKNGQGNCWQWMRIFCKQNIHGHALASVHGRARPSWSMAAPHLPLRPKLLDLHLLRRLGMPRTNFCK